MKKIFLGVSGSIAAMRSPDFIRHLKSNDYEVECVLSSAAKEFVTSTTIETFLGKRILSSDPFAGSNLGTDHIKWARWSDAIVIYGATAHTIAKLAAGLTDDLLSLNVLAFKGPVFIAPAMNPSMYEHASVVSNLLKLKSWDYHVIEPEVAQVACGEYGKGHVASFEKILSEISQSDFVETKLNGKSVLISAGPMRSYIDKVRYIQNLSSGKMGIELCKEALKRNANVTVLLGPVDDSILKQYLDLNINLVKYVGVTDYQDKLRTFAKDTDLFISAAAVLDFDCETSASKLSRKELGAEITLKTQSVQDFVQQVASQKMPHQKIVSFSLESGSNDEILARAQAKLLSKKADLSLVNRVSDSSGPNSDSSDAWIIDPKGAQLSLGRTSKTEISKSLFAEIEKIL